MKQTETNDNACKLQPYSCFQKATSCPHSPPLHICCAAAHSCLLPPNPTCWEGSSNSPTLASSQFTASVVRPGCPRRSEPLQTAAVFETGACNQQLAWRPGSLHKAKQHRLMLMRHNAREPSNTQNTTYVSQPWHLAVWMANLYQVQISAAPAPVPVPGWQPLPKLGWVLLLHTVLLDPCHDKHKEHSARANDQRFLTAISNKGSVNHRGSTRKCPLSLFFLPINHFKYVNLFF